jgi:hypothetical protein
MTVYCACGHTRTQHRAPAAGEPLRCVHRDGWCTCDEYVPMRSFSRMWQDELYPEELREMQRQLRVDKT